LYLVAFSGIRWVVPTVLTLLFSLRSFQKLIVPHRSWSHCNTPWRKRTVKMTKYLLLNVDFFRLPVNFIMYGSCNPFLCPIHVAQSKWMGSL
jgi:hypothetical protein